MLRARDGRRAAAFLLVLALALAACSGQDDEEVALEPVVVEETRTVIGEEGGLAIVGEASLTVPAGSLEAGTVVLAQQLDATALATSDVSVAAVPGPVRFLADGEVTGPLVVRIPVREGVEDVRILSSDENSVLWFDEETTLVDGFAVAEVDHLSEFDPTSGVSNLTYSLFRMLGARAEFPECPNGPPEWVTSIDSLGQDFLDLGLEPNAPLLACGDRTTRDGEEALALRITASRGYSVVVRKSGPTVDRVAAISGGARNVRSDLENTGITWFADGLTSAYRDLGMTGVGDLIVIPALRTSDLIVTDPRERRPVMGSLSVESVSPLAPEALALSLLVDLVTISVGELGTTVAEDIADCVWDAEDLRGQTDIGAILDFYNDCLIQDGDVEDPGFLARGLEFVESLKTPVQIGLLTVERVTDSVAGPDSILVAFESPVMATAPAPTPVPSPAPEPEPSPAPSPAPVDPNIVAMHRGDPARTGVARTVAPRSAPTVQWELDLSGSGASSAGMPSLTVVAGVVYVATGDGVLVSLLSLDGAERWRFAPPGSGRLSIPTVVDQLVIVHGEDSGIVHAVDVTTGAERWRTPLRPGAGTNGGILVGSGRLFVHTSGGFEDPGITGQVNVLDARSGAVMATFDVPSDYAAGMTLADDRFIVGGSDPSAFNVITGERIWAAPDPYGIADLFAIHDGRAITTYVPGGFSPGYASAYDLATGASLWSSPEITTSSGYTVEVVSEPAVDGFAVYVGGYLRDMEGMPPAQPFGTVQALKPGTGLPLWDVRVRGAVTRGPTIAEDVLLVPTYLYETETGSVVALDRTTGRELWVHPLDGNAGHIAVSGGTVYVADETNTITALR